MGSYPLERHAAELLFQLLASRYELGSLVVTSKLDFKDWSRVFGDEPLTAALLDRLTHNAEILAFAGESYRFKQSMRRREMKANRKQECGAAWSNVRALLRTGGPIFGEHTGPIFVDYGHV